MPPDTTRLHIAISSRTLFDLSEEDRIFREHGQAAFRAHQDAHFDVTPAPGVGMPLVKKLLAVNVLCAKQEPVVKLSIVSRNDPLCGRRMLRACEQYGLAVDQGIFTGGASRTPYLKLINAQLFLTSDPLDTRDAIAAGIPAAMLSGTARHNNVEGCIRIAFDGDAVLFDDEAERVNKQSGLMAFREHERIKRILPLSPGPMHDFLAAIQSLRNLPDMDTHFRIALVTARGMEAAERALNTLHQWGMKIDEAFFLGGKAKAGFLKEFNADIFFDDQEKHLKLTRDLVPSGHVIFGVANESAIGDNSVPISQSKRSGAMRRSP
mgnify:CR=1 FL=1